MSDRDAYHVKDYSEVCCTGAVGVVSSFLHRTLEVFGIFSFKNKLVQRPDCLQILEVGAGAGQHARYVRHRYDYLTQSDIRPQNILNESGNERILSETRIVDAQNLPYSDSSFDRVIATCLLAHLDHPEKALSEWKRVVRPGGVISIFIPCEPGIVLRVLQSVTTRRKQKKLGYDAWLLHYREHRNHHPGMMTYVKHIYGSDIRITNYPFPFLGWNLNLWSIVQVMNLEK